MCVQNPVPSFATPAMMQQQPPQQQQQHLPPTDVAPHLHHHHRQMLPRPPFVDPTTNIIYDTDHPDYEGWLTKQSMWLKVRASLWMGRRKEGMAGSMYNSINESMNRWIVSLIEMITLVFTLTQFIHLFTFIVSFIGLAPPLLFIKRQQIVLRQVGIFGSSWHD